MTARSRCSFSTLIRYVVPTATAHGPGTTITGPPPYRIKRYIAGDVAYDVQVKTYDIAYDMHVKTYDIAYDLHYTTSYVLTYDIVRDIRYRTSDVRCRTLRYRTS